MDLTIFLIGLSNFALESSHKTVEEISNPGINTSDTQVVSVPAHANKNEFKNLHKMKKLLSIQEVHMALQNYTRTG